MCGYTSIRCESADFPHAEEEGLLEINCFINESVGLIICRHCCIAVPPEHLRSHLMTKHDLYRSAEELESILDSYSVMSLEDTMAFVKYIDTLPESIGGLPVVENGYKCLICPHSWSTMRDHSGRSHRGKKASVDSEKCPVQLVFHGKLRKYIGITYVKTKEDALRNPTLVHALALEDEEEEMEVPSTKRHKSLWKCSMFVARSRWDILIEKQGCRTTEKDCESAAAEGTADETGEMYSGIFQTNIGEREDRQCACTKMGDVNGVNH